MIKQKTRVKSKSLGAHKRATNLVPASPPSPLVNWSNKYYKKIRARNRDFMSRRPHRSFRLTRRRDYVRSLKLPGYISFTGHVWSVVRRHRNTLGLLVILYACIIIFLGGITNQQAYSEISDLLEESGPSLFADAGGKIGEAGLLMLSAFASGPGELSVEQQIFLGLTLLLVWLTTVWLLREYLLGRSPRLRDGLYNSGSPFVSTLVLSLVFVLQCLPLGVTALVYAALSSVGLLQNGFSSMLFWILAAAIAAMVLYWITSTVIALVVVTLPGMYPFRALKSAGDLVVGRRLRILYRLLWASLIIAVAWIIVMIPLLLVDTAIKDAWNAIADLPTMPLAAAIMTAASTVWFAAYTYLLYRKVVDDDAKPA